ncbi:peptidoglycan bridge formation glycyltransferase FemA/FemB family protein [Flavivirga amylovorans]|uniref:Peptidoglycan bridge formation glycyltransferase FemA/FemB family protein n=1 Tax=Flavivirga amylovorans TaxID=870486 RepID=A0ABT8X1V8_9FLAO|nr:peptidoglycan bridge formation glycyltransferase FemA/FemB family protein [Flavivirga amylovorans]MDO5987906.1 peptidoglycan bridge formation glycyltransferase FemA/FemB family protein [Flavivirga amylovorans]
MSNKSKLKNNFKIIVDKAEWQQTLNDIGHFDFYHTYDYHYLSKKNDEKAVLFKYTEENYVICFPFLIRKIKNSAFFDATSVYGYAGPLQKNIDANFNNQHFIKTINDYFVEENIISVFSRLNPFIKNQSIVLNNIGETKSLGNIVNIDLTKNLEKQKENFSKTTVRYINKGKKLCDVRLSNCPSDVDNFINIYYENMERVKAKKDYYFSKEYFLKFINSTDYQTDIFFAIYKETKEIISAALVVKTNDVVQYHLSGTKSDYLHLSPIRMIIDEIRISATKENKTFFNLGGGLGNMNDGIFRFKSSFSKDFKPFKIWKHIVNLNAYNRLTEEHVTPECDPDFFPLYRCNEL